jgi:CHAT domain-containing protein
MKLFLISVSMTILCISTQAQKGIENDFTQISILGDQADYKGGYFYTKKTLAFILRKEKENEINLLRATCYLALFADKLDKKEEVALALQDIQRLLPALTKEVYKKDIAATFEVYCDFYHQRGIFITTDSVYNILQKNTFTLPPYDKELINYYHLYAQYKMGFLNDVSSSVNKNIAIVQSIQLSDSIFNNSGEINYQTLDATHVKLHQNLLAKYILLKGYVYLENGYSDSTIAYTKKELSYIKQEIHNREGYKAQLFYLQALGYIDQLEYASATHTLKSASALSQQYYLAHAPIQLAIENALVIALEKQNKLEEAAYYHNDAAVKVYGYYGRNSLAYAFNASTNITPEIQNRNFTKAESALQELLTDKNLPAIHFLREQYLTTLFNVYLKQQKYVAADSILTVMLALQAQLTGKNNPNYNLILLEKAYFYSYYLDKFEDAEKIYAQTLDIDLKNKIAISHPAYIKASVAFADLHIYNEAFEASRKRIDANLIEVEKTLGKQHPIYAIYLYELAELQTMQGDFNDAGTTVNTSIQIFKKDASKKYVRNNIIAIEMAIKLYVIEGDYPRADSLLKSAKTIARSTGISDNDDIFLVEEIGLLYIKKGEYQKANRLLSAILKNKVQNTGANHKNLCNTLNYLGEQNLIVGNYSEADAYFDRSLKINKAAFGEKSIPYATSLLFYKQLYSTIGDYEKAEQSIKDALAIYSKSYGEKNIKTGVLMHQYALAVYEADQNTNRKNKTPNKTIETYFTNSLQIIKNAASDQSTLYAEALENFAIFYAQTGQAKKALENIAQAKKIWETNVGVLNVHNAQLDYIAGKINYRSGQYATALTLFQQSGDQYKNLFNDVHPGYVFALGSTAQMHYILGNNAKAIESIEECTNKSLLYIDEVFPFLSERGKMAYWDKIKDDFEFYKTIAFTNSESNPAMIEKIFNIQLQTKSLLLNSLLKIKNRIYASGDTTSIRLYQDWQNTRDNLSIAYSMTSAQKKENGVDIAALESTLEYIEKELSSISADFVENSKNNASQLYNWKTLKESLREDEIAIETIPFRLFTKSFSDTTWYAFVTVNRNSKKPDFIIEKNGRELETKYLKYYRNLMKFEQEDNNSYKQYWQPISTLISDKYKTIYFAGDGVYNQINLETLRDEKGEYLINSKNIVCIGTCRDIINKSKQLTKNTKATNATSSITIIGNPTYYTTTPVQDQTVSALPGSQIEATKIDSLLTTDKWKVTLFTGSNATEDTVKLIQSPKVLHISTHGFFWTSPTTENNSADIQDQAAANPLLKSGILLYNGGELMHTQNINTINKESGILTAYEAMNLSLDNTELVVLSACETGLGEVKTGEGVYGLQRSFTVAGSKCIIMSLSKVSDAVTIELMTKFYTYWIQSGNKREAFIKAKKDLMLTYPPKYWGAFIMIGM